MIGLSFPLASPCENSALILHNNSTANQTGKYGAMAHLRGQSRMQATLFPEALDDLIDPHAQVRVIDAFVANLDLASLGFGNAVPAATGRPGYDPADLLKLYVYGYLNQVRSMNQGLPFVHESGSSLAFCLHPVLAAFSTSRLPSMNCRPRRV